MNIESKVVYITGATKGIGRGIAEQLLKQNCKVVLSGRDKDTVDAISKELSSYGQVLGVVSDVRDYEQEQNAVQKIIEVFGKLDVVIANAGLGIFAPVHELSLEQWNAMIDTNLTGAFHTLKASADQLIKNKGYYISISSLAGTNFFEKASGYNASKFGLVGFTQAAMLDLRQYGVKVTTIMPGSVTSNFNNHVPSEQDAWKIQPSDIGQLVVDLLKMNPNVLPSKIEVRPAQTK